MAIIIGTSGNDTLTGTSGNDILIGLDGNDVLRGAAGADHLDGGAGIDSAMYSENTVGVAINLGTGTGAGGTAQGDILTGIENVYGGSGNDALIGSNTNDGLVGGAGNDVLIGLGGKDTLIGGLGADRFTYGSVGQSPVGAGADRITDFSHAQGDRIDLAGIDANSVTAGDQAFAFIGAAAFGHHAGELRGGRVALALNPHLRAAGRAEAWNRRRIDRQDNPFLDLRKMLVGVDQRRVAPFCVEQLVEMEPGVRILANDQDRRRSIGNARGRGNPRIP